PRRDARQRRQEPVELAADRVEARRARGRLEVNHQVEGGQAGAPGAAPEALPCPALEPVADDRAADLAADGDAEPGVVDRVRLEMERGEGAMAAPPGAVAALVVGAAAEGLPPRQPLARGCRGRGHGPQTVRRLRPLRRRRARTLRPFLVLIRSRKPW